MRQSRGYVTEEEDRLDAWADLTYQMFDAQSLSNDDDQTGVVINACCEGLWTDQE